MQVDWKTLPMRMRELPRDPSRGNVPVPWFVEWVDGKPEFRAMNPYKWRQALMQSLCWVCGQKMGPEKVFVAGPMCGINRTSSEPPSHYRCAQWSALNCPFLANPRMVRREDQTFNGEMLRENSPGIALSRNPGVTMLWVTRYFTLFPDGMGKQLIEMGEPSNVEWYCERRVATRIEVFRSIETGLPALAAIARLEEGGLDHLRKQILDFGRFLPAPTEDYTKRMSTILKEG